MLQVKPWYKDRECMGTCYDIRESVGEQGRNHRGSCHGSGEADAGRERLDHVGSHEQVGDYVQPITTL